MDAIRARHAVRRYTDRPLEASTVETLLSEIGKVNSASGLHVQLVRDEPEAFSSGVLKYGAISGVRNYLAMVGKTGKDAEEKVGYWGEHLVLLAQTLGLNTCWVGLTFKKVDGVISLPEGEKVHCVIALGYGEDAGKQHPLRPAGKFYEAEGPVPQWFLDGMEAAMLAPTAVNQQKFRFVLRPGGKVEAKALFSMVGYTHIDLGIVKYHFEVGAGKENFEWA